MKRLTRGRGWRRTFWWRGLGIAFFTGLIGIAGINAWILKHTQSFHYTRPDSVPPTRVAIILGAYVHSDGQVSGMLRARLEEGIALYRQGKARKLLLSGDHGRPEYDEVNAMRQYVASRGIPPEDIFLDHAGFDTYDSLYRAQAVFQVHDAVVVTQRFHLARAIYTARALGLNAVGLEAEPFTHLPHEMRRLQAREALARLKAFAELHVLRPQPKYLGETIVIGGDGRRTWDSL